MGMCDVRASWERSEEIDQKIRKEGNSWGGLHWVTDNYWI